MSTEPRCVVQSRHPDGAEAEVGYLCGDCFQHLRSKLVELPAVATWLEVNIAAGGVAGEKVSGTREDPIPLRQDVLDLIGPDSRRYPYPEAPPIVLLWEDGVCVGAFETWREGVHARWAEVLDSPDLDADPHRWQVRVTERGGCDQQGVDSMRAVLMHWSRIVCEEGPFPWTDRNDLVGLVEWLSARLSWIAGQPWVDELVEDIRRLGSRAHQVAPWRAITQRDPQPCTSCDVRALVLHVAEGVLRCEKRLGGCGRAVDSPYLKQASA